MGSVFSMFALPPDIARQTFSDSILFIFRPQFQAENDQKSSPRAMVGGARFRTPIFDPKMLQNGPKMESKIPPKSPKVDPKWNPKSLRDPSRSHGSLRMRILTSRSQFWSSRDRFWSLRSLILELLESNWEPSGADFWPPDGLHAEMMQNSFGCIHSAVTPLHSSPISGLQTDCMQKCCRIHSHAFIPQSPHCSSPFALRPSQSPHCTVA